MPVERRIVAAPKLAAVEDASETFDADDENDKNRSSVLAYARERLPMLFILCLLAVFLCDRALHWGQNESSNEVALAAVRTRDALAGVAGNSFGNIDSDEISHQQQQHQQRDGFMVLGMHRSGTSMLTGLLYMAAGYTFGGQLHKGAENPKGFFERFDAVNQNGKWMRSQGVSWNMNVLNYSWEKSLEELESGNRDELFKAGKKAMSFFNNPENAPWLQKDPRMCITLKTWLNLKEMKTGKKQMEQVLSKEPAIVFTYRNPLETALSLQKRGPRMYVARGLRLWMAYNMRAIQNSRGLCIVRTSNAAVVANPPEELQRISDELTNKCGVIAPATRVKQTEIAKFIDPKLQHHNAKANDEQEVLETHNDGTCVVHSYESMRKKYTPAYKQERKIYLQAMKIFCDFQSGKAYEEDYEWPDMSEKLLPANSLL